MQIIDFLRRTFSFSRGVMLGMPEDAAQRDPIEFFSEWHEAADRAGLLMPESLTLATATPDGKPSARMVLLKSVDQDGFVFFTNYGSQKARELDQNPNAAMVFHWNALQRQVRVEGVVEKVSEQESRDYFNSRERGSQIGAWASRQGETLDSRETLMQRNRDIAERFKTQEVPLPPFWGGYRLKPDYLEFWQGRASRLHDRITFTREGDSWTTARLFP